jgi:hypothetical protein
MWSYTCSKFWESYTPPAAWIMVNPLPSSIFGGQTHGMWVVWPSRNDDIKCIEDDSGVVMWAEWSSPSRWATSCPCAFPLHSPLCDPHRKIQKSGKVNATAWRYGHEGFVQATLVKYMITITWTNDSIHLKNLKIRSLRTAKWLSKICLKPKNHTSKICWILVKNYPILIIFTLFRIPTKN